MWAGGRLPAAAAGHRSSALAHVSDIFPTFAHLAGIGDHTALAAVATGPAPLDGVSLVPVLIDPTTPSPRTEVLHEGQGWKPDVEQLIVAKEMEDVHVGGVSPPPSPPQLPGALRVGDWKLIVGSNKYAGWYTAPEDSATQAAAAAHALCKLGSGSKFPPANVSTACAPYCLFNLVEDPCETRNLAASQPARVATLLARLAQLSRRPVPYDSCLPGCTAALACDARLDYHNFFGPYYPKFPKSSGRAAVPSPLEGVAAIGAHPSA